MYNGYKQLGSVQYNVCMYMYAITFCNILALLGEINDANYHKTIVLEKDLNLNMLERNVLLKNSQLFSTACVIEAIQRPKKKMHIFNYFQSMYLLSLIIPSTIRVSCLPLQTFTNISVDFAEKDSGKPFSRQLYTL